MRPGLSTILAIYEQLLSMKQAAEIAGLSAGDISDRVGLQPNALTYHLSRLVQADLVIARRMGRQIFYAIRYERLTALMRFLIEDCCASAPSGCLPECPTKLFDEKPEVKAKPPCRGSKD